MPYVGRGLMPKLTLRKQTDLRPSDAIVFGSSDTQVTAMAYDVKVSSSFEGAGVIEIEIGPCGPRGSSVVGGHRASVQAFVGGLGFAVSRVGFVLSQTANVHGCEQAPVNASPDTRTIGAYVLRIFGEVELDVVLREWSHQSRGRFKAAMPAHP